MKIVHGDKITAYNKSFTVETILYQDYFGDRSTCLPGSDCYGYDIEFIDPRGQYHHWKQNQDGGSVARWNGRRFEVLNSDGYEQK